jgi:hypothetical protein
MAMPEQKVPMTDILKAGSKGPALPNQNAPPLCTLVGRTAFVVLSNLVTLSWVIRLG